MPNPEDKILSKAAADVIKSVSAGGDVIKSVSAGGDLNTKPAKLNTRSEKETEQPRDSRLRPSLQNYKTNLETTRANAPRFAENQTPNVQQAVKSTSPAVVAVNRLKNSSPEQRARVGARVGASVGLGVQGLAGGVIGAAVGSYAARGAGLVQAGVHEDNQRKNKVLEALDNLGIRNKKTGSIDFSDGGSAALTADRVFGNEQGTGGASDLEQIDMTSPFARRTTAVARPLARYLAQGLLGYTDNKNERDMKAVDNTTAMLINSLQDGAKDIDTVYNRAREMASKIGISADQARTYFKQKRGTFEENERQDIEKGLEIIYG